MRFSIIGMDAIDSHQVPGVLFSQFPCDISFYLPFQGDAASIIETRLCLNDVA